MSVGRLFKGMLSFIVCLTLVVTPALVHSASCPRSILFLPLDERYTTRVSFLNLAKVSPYCIISPPTSMLPVRKEPCDLDQLHEWVDENVKTVDAMIISAEMFLYGGLIASRISNDTTAVIFSRMTKLFDYQRLYPNLAIYVSTVVMRIPAYNGDFEEPWYWADYGYALFNYSFYSDKYAQLNDPEDLARASMAKSLVPSDAVDEFLWRRERNNNVTTMLVNTISSTNAFKFFYITMDDNAEYGFNIRESSILKSLVSELKLEWKIPIYPGADEVQLTLLSRYSVVDKLGESQSLRMLMVYRVPSTIEYIPGYEGQPMVDTLYQQTSAAGGVAVESSGAVDEDLKNVDCVLLVNNFDTMTQQEASEQSSTGSIELYDVFTPYVVAAISAGIPIGFCDNRFANGADIYFVQYMNSQAAVTSLKSTSYAGWNTNGNTIGTVVANTNLLTLFQESFADENSGFNSLRILEDMWYQADIRQQLNAYVNQIEDTDESTSNLEPDLSFYERYCFKVLESRYHEIMTIYGLKYTLESVYFPWNRTFEIGFTSSWSEN